MGYCKIYTRLFCEKKTKTYKHNAIWYTRKAGRPTKGLRESNDRTKRRKTEELRAKVPAEELTYATQISHCAEGNNDVPELIKNITLTPT